MAAVIFQHSKKLNQLLEQSKSIFYYLFANIYYRFTGLTGGQLVLLRVVPFHTSHRILNCYKFICELVLVMQLHDICLSCGHRKDEHSSDGSRCQKAYCPCFRFKTTFLQYGSGL